MALDFSSGILRDLEHGRRPTSSRTRPIREGGTGPAVALLTQSSITIFLRERGVREKRQPESRRRADRAPGRCRAGGGLLGGKDPTGREGFMSRARRWSP